MIEIINDVFKGIEIFLLSILSRQLNSICDHYTR